MVKITPPGTIIFYFTVAMTLSKIKFFLKRNAEDIATKFVLNHKNVFLKMHSLHHKTTVH